MSIYTEFALMEERINKRIETVRLNQILLLAGLEDLEVSAFGHRDPTPEPPKWDIDKARENSTKLSALLEQGWEPYSYSSGGLFSSKDYVHLRKEIKEV